MATPVMRSGSGTGKMPAVMSSSCWAVGMKRAVASCAWPALPMMVRWTLRLRMPDCLAEEYGKYLVIPHVRFAYGARAGAGGVGEQRRVCGLSARAW